MMIFEIRNKDGVTVAVEEDFGNAAEHEMVLSEMHPEEKFTIVKVLRKSRILNNLIQAYGYASKVNLVMVKIVFMNTVIFGWLSMLTQTR